MKIRVHGPKDEIPQDSIRRVNYLKQKRSTKVPCIKGTAAARREEEARGEGWRQDSGLGAGFPGTGRSVLTGQGFD